MGERLKPYLMDLTTWLTDQMPAIEEGLMHFMDYVDEKVDDLKGKIEDFTSTDAWENADMFGKISIAWDELIAEPFSEWWDSKGHGSKLNPKTGKCEMTYLTFSQAEKGIYQYCGHCFAGQTDHIG